MAPSIPRIIFEQRMIEQVRQADGLHLAGKTKWGDLVEPLTWFYAPTGVFRLVGPATPMSDVTGPQREFREVILRYQENPRLYMLDIFCDEGEYFVAAPDAEGTYRYLENQAKDLSVEEQGLFCDRDWTNELQELQNSTLTGSR